MKRHNLEHFRAKIFNLEIAKSDGEFGRVNGPFMGVKIFEGFAPANAAKKSELIKKFWKVGDETLENTLTQAAFTGPI